MSPPKSPLRSPIRRCLHRPVSRSNPLVTHTPPSSPCHPGSQVQIDCHANGSLVERNHTSHGTRGISKIPRRCPVTIDMLPDDALLELFDFFLRQNECIDAWHPLVHVCQKWRNIVFGSPRRLNLHLHCTVKKPVREKLHVWPEFPIVIGQYGPPTSGLDSILAALEHRNRVCELVFRHISSSLWEKVLEAMQVPFPALTRLDLVSEDKTMPVVPDSFLGGSAAASSAPRLRSLYMTRIPFPGLPRLLSYATDLVDLELYDIPQSGYISPDTMITCLSTLTNLESLRLEFEQPRPRCIQESARPPPYTRSALPCLTHFNFRGVSEYLEDLVARMDSPFLDELHITFFNQLILDTPQLAQFISRTPNLKAPNDVQVKLLDGAVQVLLGPMQQISIRAACKAPDWQLSFVAQVCSSSLCLIPSLEHLYICDDQYSRSRLEDDIENDQWLELLRPFGTVKNLYLSRGVVPRIAPALQELVGQRLTKVLPALQGLLLEEPWPLGLVEEPHLSGTVRGTIEKFVASRLLHGHPIAVSHWDRK